MSTHYNLVIKYENIPNICFHEVSKNFVGTKQRVRISRGKIVNEPSVFELLRFDCICNLDLQQN